MGLLRAILDAVLGEADLAGGRAITRLTAVLAADATEMFVESTLRFGELYEGENDGLVLVNGEIIYAGDRTASDPFRFFDLERGFNGTKAIAHPSGSLVLDISRNRTAIDITRRGFLVDFALSSDLDVIGRNLGLHRCPGLDDETWRRLIKALAYLPKNTIDAFEKAMEALQGDTDSFTIYERLISDPYKVFVQIESALSASVRGRFLLTGGFVTVTTGLSTVPVTIFGSNVNLRTVGGVYLNTVAARRGSRLGTNFFAGGGSFTPGDHIITLGSSPGAIGTSVIVDFTAYGAEPETFYHYLADDETIRDSGDMYAYLSDPLLAARCVLDQIRPAGTAVVLSTKL